MKTIIYSDDEHQFISEDWIFGKYTPHAHKAAQFANLTEAELYAKQCLTAESVTFLYIAP